MKKTVTVVCALMCAAFLCACAAEPEGKPDLDGTERESTGSIVIMPAETLVSGDGQTDNIQQKVTSEGGETLSINGSGTTPDRQEPSPAVQMRGLMQGNLGGMGLGFLAYTLPGQDGEDYKLCFFREGGQGPDSSTSLSELGSYPLEMADYIFPDVRENNAPIGKFIEIYFYDTVTIGEDGAAGLAVVATYDTNGETCYDTRIYRWNGAGYSAEEAWMQELNEKYRVTQDYPVEALYHLSSGTGGQSL